MNEMHEQPGRLDIRVALLEQSIKHIYQTLCRIESDLKDLRKTNWTQFAFLLGAMGGLFATIAHGFHWL